MSQNGSDREPILSLRNVGLFYWRKTGYFSREKFWALRDVSFDLYHGESLGVIGRNGAGKTTLLQLLSGITSPDLGTITNKGFSASMLSLRIGFVPYLTGRENSIMSGILLGMRRSEIKSRLAHIQEFAELGEFYDQPISTYSSGMEARLGFAVALNMNPDILLIDEVLTVGDSRFQVKSAIAIREKIRSNRTVVLVTHAAHLMEELCDRVVWIEEGVTKAVGPTATVLKAYQEFVNQTLPVAQGEGQDAGEHAAAESKTPD